MYVNEIEGRGFDVMLMLLVKSTFADLLQLSRVVYCVIYNLDCGSCDVKIVCFQNITLVLKDGFIIFQVC